MNAKELLNKYIKYDSKITFDIFKLMYQKLIDLNFINPHDVEEAFEEFSGRYEYFLMKLYDGKLYFNQYDNVTSLQSEISVEDLLGYNPFENLQLPKQWCVKVTEDNKEVLRKWRTDGNCHTGYYLLSPYHSYSDSSKVKIGYAVPFIPEDTIEITFEQFKEFVMNEPVKIETSKTEKDWSKATKEELLEEARRNYPMGTEYIPLLSNGKVDTTNIRSFPVSYPYRYLNGGIHCGIGYVYAKGNWAEIISLPDTKVEEVVPEYVECSYSETDTFIINKIYKCEPLSKADALTLNSEKGSIINNLPYEGSLWKFKPSTKEAFGAQNKPQSIEKWNVGSYIVPLQDRLLTRDEPLIKGKPYQITKRSSVPYIMCEKNMEINFCDDDDPETKEGIKWFATLKEAEEFAKTLIKSGENDIECNESQCTHEVMRDTPKQLLRQAVHCRTQEEWDFACDKYGKSSKTKKDFPKYDTFDYTFKFTEWYPLERYIQKGYQILSFQEWCDLNGYKDITTLQTPEICTYGLNVGDELDETILNAWDKKGLNYYTNSSDGWIFGNSVPYYGDRKIEKFKVIDGVVGFLVSGTVGIYLRAEGFKEFAENYNKSKEPEVKFEIDKWYKVYDGNVELYKGVWYVKSPKIIDGIVKVDQYLYNDCLGEGGNFGYVGDYTFVEVPLSEIQHLLLKCPSDKIEKATQNVVKVNTCKVRITSSEIKVLKF